MYCPNCGANLSDNAQFCMRCGSSQIRQNQQGASVVQPNHQAQYAGQPFQPIQMEQLRQQAASRSFVDALADHTSIIIGVAGGVLAILAFMLVLYGLGVFAPPASQQLDKGMTPSSVVNASEEIPVHVDVALDNDDKLVTPVPVRATGTDIHGNAVTRTAYINSRGEGLTLPAGHYMVNCLASPVSEKGHLFNVNGLAMSIDVPDVLQASTGQERSVSQADNPQSPQSAPVSVSMKLETADVHEFTNEELKLVREYAIEGGVDKQTVEEVMAPIEEQVAEQSSGQSSDESSSKADDKSDKAADDKDSGDKAKDDKESSDKNDKAKDDKAKDDKESGDKGDKAKDEGGSKQAAGPLPGEASEGSSKSVDKSGESGNQSGTKPAAQANGSSFGSSQLYKSVLYAGDVRTMGGDKPITLLPNCKKPPVQAEQFLFADNTYYYVENFPGNGSGAVKLHKYDLETKKDVVLASDVTAPSKVSYANGKIVYQVFNANGAKSMKVAVVDAADGAATVLDFGEQKGLTTFHGIVGGKAIVSVSLYGEPTRVLAADLVGGEPTQLLSLGVDESVMGVFDGAIVTIHENTSSAYDSTGAKTWSSTLPESRLATSSAYFADGVMYAVKGDLENSNDIIGVNLKTGEATLYKTGLAYSVQVVYADSSTIYFCAEPLVGSGEQAPNGMYTYSLDKKKGTVTRLDDNAPKADVNNMAKREDSE